MKNRKLFRLLCLFFAVCLLTGLVFSVNALVFVGDMNGDGKVTAFDAQLIAESKAGLRSLSTWQQKIAESTTIQQMLGYVLGSTTLDSGDVDGNSQIEIYTAAGLQQLRNVPDADYILMADIDLAGADWIPLSGFTGSLNGNGHTISNLHITKGAPSAINTNSDLFNMGFFGDVPANASISDLHLRNVTITATEDALYLGLLAGSNRGQISGCTATGTIIDNRPSHGIVTNEITFIGALVGRIPDPNQNQNAGSVIGGTALSVFDEQGQYETSGLCADVKLLIADRAGVNLVDGVSKKIGVVGSTPSGATVSGLWCDSTNSSDLLSEAIQQRQDIAVDYMNAMGTVAWTPSEELVYKVPTEASFDSSRTYSPGTTYYGLPYNHHNGSYERFLTAMESRDENGVYTTKTGLGDSLYYVNDAGVGGYDGFVQIMGNDCSTSLSWAWMQISPSRVNVTTESYAGGVNANRTRYLVPNDSNRQNYGVYPVGTWTSSHYDTSSGTWTAIEYDPSLAAYPITDERSSEDILEAIGQDGMLEVYAQTHKADGLVRHRADPIVGTNGTVTYEHYGHCRMVVADPVVIRGADGVIDADKSYFLTTEQGSSTGNTSTWKVNYKRSFAETVTHNPKNPYNNNGPYLPMTIRALKDETVKAPYITAYPKEGLTGPVSGKFYCNYRFQSIHLTVTDADGKVYYDKDAFTGILFDNNSTRGSFTTVSLSELHQESFAAAAERSMTANQTYYYTVVAVLSNGEQINLNQKYLGETSSEFIYKP